MGKGSITETLVEARLGRGWRRYGWSEAANRGSELRWSLPVGARSPVVKNLIETCIYKYMSLEETVTYVEDNHKISHHLTKPSFMGAASERESRVFQEVLLPL
ncbi:hypothetical protein AtEden1_Chr2g0230071 [Arabidopsis thaliana]